jgi:pyruvate/2-oxoglutarate dehydrogenase complex dihydrolipoamide dehydrogenase (E3) component
MSKLPARETDLERLPMKFDAIIIGSGQAGNPLSYRFADLGWRVALIEKAEVGGTCINTGCTPTKVMVHRAQVAYYARNAARWGVHAENVSADLKTIVAQKDKVVHDFRTRRQEGIEKHTTIKLYRGRARFLGAHQIQVGEALLESEKIFIDTGGRARIPDIPGFSSVKFLTNRNIMELTSLPEHLIVLGAGYIGLEFGQMFRRFGSRVTLIHRSNQIIPREDPEVSAELQKILEAEGIEFLLNAQATRAEQKGNSIAISVNDAKGPATVTGSHLLVAIGRQPNTDDLGLEMAGVETDKFGFVKVNSRLETNVPGIWALGDVKGGPAFTHISYNDFQIVDANITQGKNLTIDKRIVPYCVFTDPQLGGVGMTEKEARAAGYKLKIGQIPTSHVARAIERDETAGLMKIVVNAANDQVLGASILSSEGGELVHVLYTLMLGGLPYTLLKGGVFIHPTLTEGFFALLDSVKPVD